MSRLQLIENWRRSWRLYTVQFGVALALLPELFYQLAMALGDVLPALPAVVLQYLPPYLRATLAVVGALSVMLRLVRQIKLPPAPDEEGR